MSPQLYGERNQLFYFFFFYDANCSSPVRQLRAGQLQSWHVSGWKTYLPCSWPAPGLYKVTFFTIVSSPTRVVRSVFDALLKRGSSVVMRFSDQNTGHSELERYRSVCLMESISNIWDISRLKSIKYE